MGDRAESKTALIVLITALVGLATAVVTVWDTIFPEPEPGAAVDLASDAEALAASCTRALFDRDYDGLADLVSLPFAFDRKRVVSSMLEFREVLSSAKDRDKKPAIVNLRVRTVSEWVESGEFTQAQVDQFGIRVRDTDFLVLVVVSTERRTNEAVSILIRNTEGALSFAGLID